jgi:hypothetical protein
MRTIRVMVLCAAFVGTLVPSVSAADLEPAWLTEVGASANDVAVGPDGSVYVVGHVPAPDPALWLAQITKLTPQGDVVWRRRFTPAERVGTWGVAVDVAPDGRVAWVGTTQRYNCEGGGWFLEIRGPAGGLIDRRVGREWRCTGTPQSATDVAIDDARAVVTGFRYGCCGSTLEDGWVRAFAPNGAKRWTVNLEPPAPTPMSWYDNARSVALGPNRIFVGGWAATSAPVFEQQPVGTMLLASLTPTGRVEWTKRVASVNGEGIVGVHDGALIVTARDEGRGMEWRYGQRASNGWLGRFTAAGDLVWHRAWDAARPAAADPDALAVGQLGIYVVGTRRDTVDMGYDAFVRWYSPGGTLLQARSMDAGERYLAGSGVAVRYASVYVSGFVGKTTPFGSEAGLLWRLTG